MAEWVMQANYPNTAVVNRDIACVCPPLAAVPFKDMLGAGSQHRASSPRPKSFKALLL